MRITIGWGITSIAMMFVKTPACSTCCAFCLACSKPASIPASFCFSPTGFPRTAGPRRSACSCRLGARGCDRRAARRQIMSGLSGVNGWAGWQWVFLLEGIPSVIAGIVTFFYLTDRPEAGEVAHDERGAAARRPGTDKPWSAHREHSIMAGLKDRQGLAADRDLLLHVRGNSTLTFWARAWSSKSASRARLPSAGSFPSPTSGRGRHDLERHHRTPSGGALPFRAGRALGSSRGDRVFINVSALPRCWR